MRPIQPWPNSCCKQVIHVPVLDHTHSSRTTSIGAYMRLQWTLNVSRTLSGLHLDLENRYMRSYLSSYSPLRAYGNTLTFLSEYEWPMKNECT